MWCGMANGEKPLQLTLSRKEREDGQGVGRICWSRTYTGMINHRTVNFGPRTTGTTLPMRRAKRIGIRRRWLGRRKAFFVRVISHDRHDQNGARRLDSSAKLVFLGKHNVNSTVFLFVCHVRNVASTWTTRDLFLARLFANRTGRFRTVQTRNPGSVRQRKPCTTAQCIIHSASTPGNDK